MGAEGATGRGGVSTGARSEFTSLTTNLIADESAEKENCVIIVYDGDSAGRAGEAVPEIFARMFYAR